MQTDPIPGGCGRRAFLLTGAGMTAAEMASVSAAMAAARRVATSANVSFVSFQEMFDRAIEFARLNIGLRTACIQRTSVPR